MNVALEPCPFCGCEVQLQSNKDWVYLSGKHSGFCFFNEGKDQRLCVPASPGQQEALIEDWNRRTQLNAIRARVLALCDAVENMPRNLIAPDELSLIERLRKDMSPETASQ